jgi:hypothetical protein
MWAEESRTVLISFMLFYFSIVHVILIYRYQGTTVGSDGAQASHTAEKLNESVKEA